MQYTIEKTNNNVGVLKLVDDITAYRIQELKDAISVLKRENKHKNVIVDLERVGYLDAFALAIITSFSRELRESGGDLKLVNVNKNIKLLFDLSRLSKVYEIFSSVEEAAKSFNGSQQ